MSEPIKDHRKVEPWMEINVCSSCSFKWIGATKSCAWCKFHSLRTALAKAEAERDALAAKYESLCKALALKNFKVCIEGQSPESNFGIDKIIVDYGDEVKAALRQPKPAKEAGK